MDRQLKNTIVIVAPITFAGKISPSTPQELHGRPLLRQQYLCGFASLMDLKTERLRDYDPVILLLSEWRPACLPKMRLILVEIAVESPASSLRHQGRTWIPLRHKQFRNQRDEPARRKESVQ
jgi:hypothetical protein